MPGDKNRALTATERQKLPPGPQILEYSLLLRAVKGTLLSEHTP